MAITTDDFDKVWASQSPLTPYEFSESQYKEGWNFVGATPPSRQMWDAFMKNADEKLQYLYQHEDIPLGHEYFTFNPNVPQGSLPLFGGEYSRETYSDLWAWVQTQTGYLKTEAEWQTLATANNGNVPYYSDGDGSTTFRVPSLKCWVKSANGTVSEVGSYLAAGLPNITGSFDIFPARANFQAGGAFSFSSTPNVEQVGTAPRQTGTSYTAEFNASSSNSIYGNANTVVPESVVGMWLVKAYGVIVDTGTIDEQQYIDDRIADLKNVYLPANYVQNKVVDLSNVATFTSSNCTISEKVVKKVGNVIQVYLVVLANSTVSDGGSLNITVSGIPAPLVMTDGSSFLSNVAIIGKTYTDNTMILRVINGSIGSVYPFAYTYSYPVAE